MALSVAGVFGICLAATSPVSAEITANGASLNGASLNGASLNGASLNGVSLNGFERQGVLLEGAEVEVRSPSPRAVTLPSGERIDLR